MPLECYSILPKLTLLSNLNSNFTHKFTLKDRKRGKQTIHNKTAFVQSWYFLKHVCGACDVWGGQGGCTVEFIMHYQPMFSSDV